MKMFLYIQLVYNMGSRYVFYRIKHEIQKKFGILKRKFPVNVRDSFFIDWESLSKNMPEYYIPARDSIKMKKVLSEKTKHDALKILKGEICFFSSEWKKLGENYNWVTNPENGFVYDIRKHWSEIADFSGTAGDIKYVWEKSRFTYLLTIIRYDYNFDCDNSEFVFAEIEDWVDANPINQGPNWRCSQEISLRIFNWLAAINFYKNSKAITEKRWNKIQNTIYWSLHHVYNHIDFSRIAVRNNHAITETLLLALSNLLFPFIPETKKWSVKGREWFEKEIEYQIYPDGTYLQFSMNYHRVVVQLLSLGISITEKNNVLFSDVVYDRAYKSVDFLYQCMDEKNGFLPNYGSNDGAWFFPLSATNYRDYRPQLNALYLILTGQSFYEDDVLSEEAGWFYSGKTDKKFLPSINRINGPLSYPVGGYYLLREGLTFTFIRCGNHKDRPAHADNLHIDVWVDGQNILRDSGTYKYNTYKEFQDFFTGSISHNTVTLGNYSQMLKGSRFIWYYWSQAVKSGWSETDGSYVFEGEISAFRFLNSKARHKRTVIKYKDENCWDIVDRVYGLETLEKKQIWHHDDFPVNFKVKSDVSTAVENQMDSYDSEFYGSKRDGSASFFVFIDEITTQIKV